MKSWIQRRLGIDVLNQRLAVLDSQQKWNIEKIIDGIRGHYVVLANDHQSLHNTIIKIPEDKDGILLLGNNIMVAGCYVSGELDPIEPINHSLQGSAKDED